MSELKIQTSSGPVSALLDAPRKPIAALTLAHGAGAGMQHPFLQDLVQALMKRDLAVLRFQFPYMEANKKRTDSPQVAAQTIAAAVGELKAHFDVPLFASGKSFGARMTTTAASLKLIENIKGIICFGFPLHAAGRPSTDRADHLKKVSVPLLFLQGTRDTLADPQLMKRVCAKLSNSTLIFLDEADHSFAVLKRSGKTQSQVLDDLAEGTLKFVREQVDR